MNLHAWFPNVHIRFCRDVRQNLPDGTGWQKFLLKFWDRAIGQSNGFLVKLCISYAPISTVAKFSMVAASVCNFRQTRNGSLSGHDTHTPHRSGRLLMVYITNFILSLQLVSCSFIQSLIIGGFYIFYWHKTRQKLPFKLFDTNRLTSGTRNHPVRRLATHIHLETKETPNLRQRDKFLNSRFSV